MIEQMVCSETAAFGKKFVVKLNIFCDQQRCGNSCPWEDFCDYKRAEKTVQYFNFKSMVSHTSFFFTYLGLWQPRDELIKHLDSLMEEKDQCHFIFAAVMVNLISRLQLRCLLLVCFFFCGCENCILYMFPSSLHSCNKSPVCQLALCSTVQTSSPSQHGEQKNIWTNKLMEIWKNYVGSFSTIYQTPCKY